MLVSPPDRSGAGWLPKNETGQASCLPANHKFVKIWEANLFDIFDLACLYTQKNQTTKDGCFTMKREDAVGLQYL